MRKQVYELTAADLEAHPVWEHCLEYEGMMVVRATLTLANGIRFPGLLYYAPEVPGQGYGPLANLQPQAITPQGQVMFWYGALTPTPEILAEAYGKLGADAKGVFPVRYASEVTLATGPISGEIPGFQYLATRRKGWFSSERVVETTT